MNTSKPTVQVILRVDPRLSTALRERARKDGESVNALVGGIIEDWLLAHGDLTKPVTA